jgi:hypothetical protein
VEIGVNAGCIYSRRIAVAEEYALSNRTGAPQLIALTRVLGWVTWFTGSICALVLIVGQITQSTVY